MDKAGDTVDFLLTAKRDLAAARRYLERAINLHGLPQKITIDKSGVNTAAIHNAMRMPALRSSYANRSTSTTSSSRTAGR